MADCPRRHCACHCLGDAASRLTCAERELAESRARVKDLEAALSEALEVQVLVKGSSQHSRLTAILPTDKRTATK